MTNSAFLKICFRPPLMQFQLMHGLAKSRMICKRNDYWAGGFVLFRAKQRRFQGLIVPCRKKRAKTACRERNSARFSARQRLRLIQT